MLNQPSVITAWVSVTLRAVCIAAGVQVRNEVRSHLMLPKCNGCREKNVVLLHESSVFVAIETHSWWQNSSVLTAVQSRSNMWDFTVHRQLCKC